MLIGWRLDVAPGATSAAHDWLFSPRPSHKEAQSTGRKKQGYLVKLGSEGQRWGGFYQACMLLRSA